jgi:hypothetical protein
MADDQHDYKVGPGRPPLHTRFRKGQSGNPGGRSKKQLHQLHALLADALNEPPSSRSTENGASKCEEVVAQLIDRLRDQVLSEMTRQIPGKKGFTTEAQRTRRTELL